MTELFERIDESGVHSVAVPRSVIRAVRSTIGDYASTNELHEGEENSNEKIGRYILQTLDDFNGIAPVFGEGVEPMALAVPAAGPIRSIIITGAAARLLRSVSLKLARNDVPVTMGNVTLQRNSVWRGLQQMAAEMRQEFEQKAHALKVSANISGAWGGGDDTAGTGVKFFTPGGGWRAVMTEMYDALDNDSVYLTI